MPVLTSGSVCKPGLGRSCQGGPKATPSFTSQNAKLQNLILASSPSKPRSAEEALHDVMGSLPARARQYIELLKESSCSGESVQRHLTLLLEQGTGCTTHTAGSARPKDSTEDRWMSCVELLDVAMKKDAFESGTKPTGWKLVRQMVSVTSMFKKNLRQGRSKDDSCAPAPIISPVHGQVLAAMLTMMLSGVTSVGMAEASMPAVPPAAHTCSEVSVSMGSSTSFMYSAVSAPAVRAERSSAVEEMVKDGRQAAVTAIRLLRAESSKSAAGIPCIAHMDDIMDHGALEAVYEPGNHPHYGELRA